MTTFNFTVRATDDRGAFADRDFSIKVRNTIIDRYMLMGSTGLYTSPDATTWTLRPGIGATGTAIAGAQTEIVNGNGRWIMMKDTSNYLMSLDGVNWAPYPLPVPAVSLAAGLQPRFGYGNGKFVLSIFHVPSGTANYVFRVFTSADGITWTSMFAGSNAAGITGGILFAGNSSTQVLAPAPVFGGGRWTIVNPLVSGANQFFTSTDGMATYSTVTHPLVSPAALVYVNGLWIATGGGGTTGCTVATSVDGVVWSAQTLPTGYQDNNWSIRKILYGNGRIVLLPSRSIHQNTSAPDNNFVFTSVDGVTFVKSTFAAGTFYSAFTAPVQTTTGTFHNGLFIIGSAGTTGANQGIFTSEDGVTWNRSTAFSSSTSIGSMGSINQD